MTRSYYRGAAGAIIVYDLSNRKTYDRARPAARAPAAQPLRARRAANCRGAPTL